MTLIRVRLEFNINPTSSAYAYKTTALRCESTFVFHNGRGMEHVSGTEYGQCYGHPNHAHTNIALLQKIGVLPKDMDFSGKSRVTSGIEQLQRLLGQMTINGDQLLIMNDIPNNFISLSIDEKSKVFNVDDFDVFAEALLYVQDEIRKMWVLNLKSEPQASAIDDLASEEAMVFRTMPTAQEMPQAAMNPQIPPDAAVQAMDAELQDLNASRDRAGDPRLAG